MSIAKISLVAAAAITTVPLGYLGYSGLFKTVKPVVCSQPAHGKMRVAYKLKTGKDEYCSRGSEKNFKRAHSIQPSLKKIGIYYNEPDKRKSTNYHFIVGAILSEGEEVVDDEIERRFEQEGYSFITLPEVAEAVQTTFPVITDMTYGLASFKVYRKCDRYIKDNELRWNPAIEVYDGKSIQYMIPQSDGEKFCVPEVRTPYFD